MQLNRMCAGILMLGLMCLASCKKESSDENPPPGPPSNEVFMNGNKFSPSTITVTAGTTIKWTNKEGVIHTVTSDTDLFDSGNLGVNQTFSFTFNSTGTFPYHCIHHVGMNGTVIVQ